MAKKCRARPGMQSRATFFRHSVVLSPPPVLLRKVSVVLSGRRFGHAFFEKCSFTIRINISRSFICDEFHGWVDVILS